MTDTCNHCATPIRWLTTKHGAHMPVDDQPSDHGNVLDDNGNARVLSKLAATAMRDNGDHLHLHHSLTCPYAHRWHKGTKTPPPPPAPDNIRDITEARTPYGDEETPT